MLIIFCNFLSWGCRRRQLVIGYKQLAIGNWQLNLLTNKPINNITIQQYNNITIQQYYNITINNITIQQRHGKLFKPQKS